MVEQSTCFAQLLVAPKNETQDVRGKVLIKKGLQDKDLVELQGHHGVWHCMHKRGPRSERTATPRVQASGQQIRRPQSKDIGAP